MTRPGPKPRPALQVVREGNPGKRPPRDSVKLAPGELVEPDWHRWWPIKRGAGVARHRRSRELASASWARVVRAMGPVGALAAIDTIVLTDMAICIARIDECEENITADGIWAQGERGAQKNPATTAANQYRNQLKFYVSELGLSPSSRERLTTGGADGDEENDSVWDT